MKSLKITLLLAVIVITVTAFTSKTEDTSSLEKQNTEHTNYDLMANAKKKLGVGSNA